MAVVGVAGLCSNLDEEWKLRRNNSIALFSNGAMMEGGLWEFLGPGCRCAFPSARESTDGSLLMILES
jgi:hypothetical protein